MPPSLVSCFHCQIFCVYVSTVSQSDCYVSLWLPTASDDKFQTKTIRNCRNPVWNETFYFQIQRKVKVSKTLSHLHAVARWSETVFAFAGIHFPPNRYLLFLYQYCQPDLLTKADGTNDRVTTQRNSDVKL